jgi:hypothetical protein
LTLLAADQFHPEFYVAVATVLPLLLVVTNLVRVYLSRWPQLTGKAGVRFWVVEFGGTTTSNVRWPRVVAIVMACINVLAEMTCLIVLFLRSSGTFTSVIIWLGLGFSMAWTLLLLSIYINVEATPRQREAPGPED